MSAIVGQYWDALLFSGCGASAIGLFCPLIMRSASYALFLLTLSILFSDGLLLWHLRMCPCRLFGLLRNRLLFLFSSTFKLIAQTLLSTIYYIITHATHSPKAITIPTLSPETATAIPSPAPSLEPNIPSMVPPLLQNNNIQTLYPIQCAHQIGLGVPVHCWARSFGCGGWLLLWSVSLWQGRHC